MAIIGRLSCHWCGFDGAHVKQNGDRHPYHHCPQCGLLTQAKSGHQASLLIKGMRAVDGKAPELPAASLPIDVPATPPAPAPARPKKPLGLFDTIMGKATA